ncbi:uncharacterized protein LOC115395784 [Salarias fasciatus]|uniref:uncharacterized protein LOC115395784 n=1 Tax=Salarias fasciatus TaxID=181472 RepID=UPI001176667F|nr:uncharacterized protein LOC115395784 [Salarias fasciatus]
MATQGTSRGGKVTEFSGEHLNLEELEHKETHEKFRGYLNKRNIPPYPHPEFHVSHLKHDTDRRRLEGIYKDSGFRGSEDEGSKGNSLMWFHLAVSPEEIRSAERKLLEEKFPESPEVKASNSFLWEFATSPAFSETSTYGSFRFTLPLQEVLDAYSQQFCSGHLPAMRVYRTSVFSQEVQYIVLVHRPEDNERFSIYPPLEDQREDAVCTYRDKHFIWNSQAMCGTHSCEMEVSEDQIKAVPVRGWSEFFVWDVVSIALHLEPEEVLLLTQKQLRKHLTFCNMFDAPFMYRRRHHFLDFDEAQLLVEGLWPSSANLEREVSLRSHFEVSEPVATEEDPEWAERRGPGSSLDSAQQPGPSRFNSREKLS